MFKQDGEGRTEQGVLEMGHSPVGPSQNQIPTAASLDPGHREHLIGRDAEAGIRREPPAPGQPVLQVTGDAK